MTYKEIIDELFAIHEEGFNLSKRFPSDDYNDGDKVGSSIKDDSFQKVYDLADKLNTEINK